MSEINVKVSGKGNLNIGNLAQGRHIKISSRDIDFTESGAALGAELLEAVRNASGGDNSRVEAVQGNVQELGEVLTSEPQNTGRIKEILNTIKEHHDWAFPAIAAIVNNVVPALGAIL